MLEKNNQEVRKMYSILIIAHTMAITKLKRKCAITIPCVQVSPVFLAQLSAKAKTMHCIISYMKRSRSPKKSAILSLKCSKTIR
jgi:hypothetical protein